MRRSIDTMWARSGRALVATLIYMVGFVALLLLVSRFYLVPAIQATKGADPATRKVMSAHALLIMVVMLLILLIGMLLTFRVGRFFRPRQTTGAKPTEYIDAWQESARRFKVPDEE